jgi:hypothetical protein
MLHATDAVFVAPLLHRRLPAFVVASVEETLLAHLRVGGLVVSVVVAVACAARESGVQIAAMRVADRRSGHRAGWGACWAQDQQCAYWVLLSAGDVEQQSLNPVCTCLATE